MGASTERLNGSLTPNETRTLTTALIKGDSIAPRWLDFIVRTLPAHAMTREQQRTVVNELMFVSTKSALEYVSINHKHLESDAVRDVTQDYVKTISQDFCLHLTHRNGSRKMEFFSPDQNRIFRECADGK